VKNEFVHRLNKLYSHPLMGHLLDSGEIDFIILGALEQLLKVCEFQAVLNPNE